MDHLNKNSVQNSSDVEVHDFASTRNAERRAFRAAPAQASAEPPVASTHPAEALTDEQICEQSPYWLADWNLSGMH
jgi:hypothetical protein